MSGTLLFRLIFKEESEIFAIKKYKLCVLKGFA